MALALCVEEGGTLGPKLSDLGGSKEAAQKL
jgi:hypothetical protein